MQAQQGFSTEVRRRPITPPHLSPKQRPGRCYTCGQEGHWRIDCPHDPANERLRRLHLPANHDAIVGSQRPDPQHTNAPLLMPLAACMSAQAPKCTTYLAGATTLFSSAGNEDVGWGCGYRNLQMLSSYLLNASTVLDKHADVTHHALHRKHAPCCMEALPSCQTLPRCRRG